MAKKLTRSKKQQWTDSDRNKAMPDVKKIVAKLRDWFRDGGR